MIHVYILICPFSKIQWIITKFQNTDCGWQDGLLILQNMRIMGCLNVEMWQYSDNGRVNGIGGAVDLNINIIAR